MKVRILFLDYLLHNSSSQLKSVGDLFACDEYQSDNCNLLHIHDMCSIEWNKQISEQSMELEDIVRASINDIARVDKINLLLKKEYKKNEIMDMQEISNTVHPHFCNARCLQRISDGDGPDSFICRKPNNLKLIPDNTKHCFIPLPTTFTMDCKK